MKKPLKRYLRQVKIYADTEEKIRVVFLDETQSIADVKSYPRIKDADALRDIENWILKGPTA